MKIKLPSFLCAVLLTACASDYTLLDMDNVASRPFETNYYSFDHANTEKAELAVRARAQELCGQRKKLAVRTESACTLKSCLTSYQCMDAEKAKAFAP